MKEEMHTGNLETGSTVSGVFLVKEKSLAVSKAGKKFLTLVLGDKQGEVEGRLWDDAEMVDEHIQQLAPVRVEGTVSVFRDKQQVNVRSITALSWTDELRSRLLATSQFSAEELVGGLKQLIDTVHNPHLAALLGQLSRDPELFSDFAMAPAGKSLHHAYLRGLLEHSLSMARISALLAGHYQTLFPGMIDRDLLIVGAMLHDIGKVREYVFEHGTDFSFQGRLVGHIVLGVEILNRLLDRIPGFPEDLALRLKHLLVSHHGEHEKGAPIVPHTMEALLLHHVDYMDSQINAAWQTLADAGLEEWSPYNRKFGRRFLNPQRPEAGNETPRREEPEQTLPRPDVTESHEVEIGSASGARATVETEDSKGTDDLSVPPDNATSTPAHMPTRSALFPDTGTEQPDDAPTPKKKGKGGPELF